MSDEHASMAGQSDDEFNYKLLTGDKNLLSEDGSSRLNRLHSLLSQWLRMENIVVLLGSGASKPQGGPVLTELEHDILTTLNKLAQADPRLEGTKNIIAHRLELQKEKSRCSFEQWISLIANAASLVNVKLSPIEKVVFSKDETVDSDALQYLVTLLSRLIYLRCSLILPRVIEQPNGHAAFLGKIIARDSNLGRAHVFTTNYDTLIEQAADDLRIHYADGFVGRVTPRFDPSSYGLDLYYPGEVSQGRVRRFDKYFHLYKLHGSVDWRRSGEEIVRVKDRCSFQWQDWKQKAPTEQLKVLESHFKEDSNSIGIIPSENKYVQTLGMPYSHLFRAFHQRLQEPQTFLIVSGYGFQDPHVNAVIDDAMGNPSLVLLVVDPTESESIQSRICAYQKAGERAFFLTRAIQDPENIRHATFTDFAMNLLPNVRWMDDLIQLRKLERDIAALPKGSKEVLTQ